MASQNLLGQLTVDHIPTPIGTMIILVDDRARLRAVGWEDLDGQMASSIDRFYGQGRVTLVQGRACEEVRAPIEAYFAGDIKALDRISVEATGTPFQRDVWAALRTIPAGQTDTYSGIAVKIGRPKAVRAVGAANGANPIGVVVPCHRVIGADGSLTGYGGGLQRKRWLLAHEGVEITPLLSV